MSRLLYEKSVAYKGHLIIPFIFSVIDGQTIYSYKLLSELGHKGKLHKLENPAGICANSVEGIINIAQEYLLQNSDIVNSMDSFKNRYTYRNNLIIIFQVAEKYFYDHYPPNILVNLAAPKIFTSEIKCIHWIKQGIERNYNNKTVEKKLN